MKGKIPHSSPMKALALRFRWEMHSQIHEFVIDQSETSWSPPPLPLPTYRIKFSNRPSRFSKGEGLGERYHRKSHTRPRWQRTTVKPCLFMSQWSLYSLSPSKISRQCVLYAHFGSQFFSSRLGDHLANKRLEQEAGRNTPCEW